MARHHRAKSGEAASLADYNDCYQAAGFPPDNSSNTTTREVLDAVALKLKSCMISRGWTLVRADRDISASND